MDNRTHVGLDVHKETTAVAVLRPGTHESDHRVIATTPEAYRKLVGGLKGTEVVFCYEAGPCGFDPYRMLSALGADCEVIAPTLIPRPTDRRVKTDRIDASRPGPAAPRRRADHRACPPPSSRVAHASRGVRHIDCVTGRWLVST